MDAQSSFALIYDSLTRQPQYKVKTRRRLSGKTDEYGQPIYTSQSALFSLNGRMSGGLGRRDL